MKKLILKILAIGIQVCAPEFSYSQQDVKARFTFIMILFVVISSSSFAQDMQDWKFLHPTPNPNVLRKIKTIDTDSWVVVGANGTYMQTSNSGTSWYYHHFAGRVAATLATTQNYDTWFFNENIGIVVGDQGYIGRTTNGGVSFDTTGNGLLASNMRCWAIWFADANTGYVGAGSQIAFMSAILKTTNGGMNWSLVYNSSTNYVTSLGGFDAMNVTAAWSNGTTVRTTNGGANWIETASQLSSFPNNITFLSSTTGFACGSSGTASITTNGGASWTPINTPTIDWSMFQIKPVSSTEVYAVGHPSFLYKTTNLGVSWESLPIAVSGPSSTFVWYSIDKIGSTLVMSGDYGVVAVSNDGGSTWSSNSANLKTSLNSDITNVPGTSKYWIVGRAFGTASSKQIMYSSNSGDTWTTFNAGIFTDLQSISMISENIGYASGTNNKVLKTTDGGQSWFQKTGPSPVATSQQYTCEFIDENTGFTFVNFSTVSGGNVFKTTNGGDNWTQYSIGAASENIYSADMVDANTGYCTMNQSNRPVYKTTNGGVNWTPLTTGLTGSIRSVTAPDASSVYICQTAGTSRVAKSTNGGANWTLLTLPVAADFTSIDFKNVNTGYVTGNVTTAVCKTTDGGVTWTFQNTHGVTNGKVYVTQGDTAWVLGGNSAISRYAGSAGNPNQFSADIHQLYISYDTISPPIVSDWGELLLTYETTNYGRYLNLSIIAPDVDTIWQIENAYLPGYSNVFNDTLSFAFDIGDSGVVVNSVQYGISLTLDTLSTAPPVQFFSPISSKPMLIASGISNDTVATEIENQFGKKHKGVKLDLTRTMQIEPNYLTNIDCGINECVPAAIHNSLNYLKNIGSIDPPNPELLSVEEFKKATGFKKSRGVLLEDWIDGDYPIDNPKMGHPGKTNYLQRVDVPMRTRELKFSGNTTQNEEYMQIVFSELQAGQNIEVIVQKSNEIYGHAVMLTGIGKSLNEASTWHIKTNDDAIQGNDSEGTRKGWTKITSGTGKNHILLGTLSSGYVHVHSFVIECPSTNSAQATPVFPANDTNIILKNLIVKGDSLEGKIYTYTIEISKDSLFTWDSLILRRDTLSRPQTKFPTNIPKEELPRTYYWRIAANNASTGDGRFSPPRKINVFSSTKSLKGAVEGRSSNFLNSELSLNADTAYFLLRNPAPPYSIVDTLFTFIETDGTLREEPLEFYADYGSYYISFSHRNTLETWSSSPVLFSESDSTEFDFSISSSQAFGNNMTFVNGNWCFYSGDVNQDGTVDATDLSLIDNDAANFVSGYVVTDLTGDDFVDGTDFAIADNNAANFVSVIRP